MPLYQLLQQKVFDAPVVDAMSEAYERALVTFDLKDRNDPITRLIAQRAVTIVESGARNPDKIYDLIVSDFRPIKR